MAFRALVYVFCILLMAAPALAEKRALVIGNDIYQNIPSLQKAREDAAGYAAFFKDQGFTVTQLTDLPRDDMIIALANFYDSIAPTDTVAFVFSGHGWSDGQQNYLLPVDIRTDVSQTLIEYTSVALRNGINGIVDQIAARKPALTIAVIDACRNNPFRGADNTRSIGLERGLAPVTAPIGTFIAFSAGESQTALDRLSDADQEPYSVFTRYFLSELRQTVDLQRAFKATQLSVNRAAAGVGHPQRPAYYDEVIGRACLTDNCQPVDAMPMAAPTTGRDPAEIAAREWDAFRETRSIRALELFVERHRGTAHAALAEERISILSAELEAAPEPQPAPEPQLASGDADDGAAQPDRTMTTPKPSFDCAKAATASEIAICASVDLASLDRKMADLFFARKATLGDGASSLMVQEQRDWLAARETCGSNVPCLMSLYDSRIGQLRR